MLLKGGIFKSFNRVIHLGVTMVWDFHGFTFPVVLCVLELGFFWDLVGSGLVLGFAEWVRQLLGSDGEWLVRDQVGWYLPVDIEALAGLQAGGHILRRYDIYQTALGGRWLSILGGWCDSHGGWDRWEGLIAWQSWVLGESWVYYGLS